MSDTPITDAVPAENIEPATPSMGRIVRVRYDGNEHAAIVAHVHNGKPYRITATVLAHSGFTFPITCDYAETQHDNYWSPSWYWPTRD